MRLLPRITLVALSYFIFSSSIKPKSLTGGILQNESKIDYLASIYFSGQNKEGLTARILVAMQDIQEKQPTESIVKQLTFLVEVKEKIEAAEDACDILDLLAAGMYALDAKEAVGLGVKMPSTKAKSNTVDAVAGINNVNSSASSLSSSASHLSWNSYYSGNPKLQGVGRTAGKVSGAANTLSGVGGTIGASVETGKQVAGVLKGLGLGKGKKDKGCKDVDQKEIRIDDRPAVAKDQAVVKDTVVNAAPETVTNTTIITLTSVDYNFLREITETLKTNENVKQAEKKFNEAASTITLTHTGTTDGIADWLLDKFSSKLKMVELDNGKVVFIKK
jgi:hypothetical protein